MPIELVIAKYNENMDWLDRIKIPYKIYDKSSKPLFDSIPLPNYGRESSTYLFHIIHNYKTLADVTVFLQGDPFDRLYSVGAEGKCNKHQIKKAIKYLNELKSSSSFSPFLQELHNVPDGTNDCPIKKKYEEIFQVKNCPYSLFTISICSQYIVPKKNILARPLSFWKNLYKMVEFDEPNGSMRGIKEKGRVCGYTLEFLWYIIFTNTMDLNAPNFETLCDQFHQKWNKPMIPPNFVTSKKINAISVLQRFLTIYCIPRYRN